MDLTTNSQLVILYVLFWVVRIRGCVRRGRQPRLRGPEWFFNVRVAPGFYEGPPLLWTRLVVVNELPVARDTLLLRLLGAGAVLRQAIAELKELHERLTKAGFDTGGTNGRIGSDTMKAVQAYQKKTGIEPADGYAGLKVLARLRAAGS